MILPFFLNYIMLFVFIFLYSTYDWLEARLNPFQISLSFDLFSAFKNERDNQR